MKFYKLKKQARATKEIRCVQWKIFIYCSLIEVKLIATWAGPTCNKAVYHILFFNSLRSWFLLMCCLSTLVQVQVPQDRDNIQLLVWLKIISVKVGTKGIRNTISSLINLTILQRILECYEPAFNVCFSIKAENCTGEEKYPTCFCSIAIVSQMMLYFEFALEKI